ncbi:MAG TPA: SHOCT domain-containing protein [Candidatus Binatia bacterium]
MERLILLGYQLLTQLPWPVPERRPWQWHFFWGRGRWGMLTAVLVMILFWGIVVGGIALIARLILSLRRDKKSAAALAILEERYAKGEIDTNEFERKKKDLRS